MTRSFARSIPWKIIGAGVNRTFPDGLGMPAFEYKQAEEIKEALKRHRVRYLFIGKSGAIILGFPDTTQDADLFVERSPKNGRRLTAALVQLGFDLAPAQAEELERGKELVQAKKGPFGPDSAFAPART